LPWLRRLPLCWLPRLSLRLRRMRSGLGRLLRFVGRLPLVLAQSSASVG
jgi:hypothetical protein